MKYLILESESEVLHSYLNRVFGGLRIKNTNYFLDDIEMDISTFKSLCRGISGENKITIKRAKVPYLEKLSLPEYARLLFKK